MARALIGNRSAVVVKTPSGDVKARAIPAGNLELQAQGRTVRVDVAAGAEAIMKAVDGCGKLDNVTGEAGTQYRRHAGARAPDHGRTDQQAEQ
ncbi:glycerol dehydratase [Salmonella sp. NCTC 11881]|nr:glycerol dehydratase [Salmonella sp. NCTC 11881]